MCYHKEQLGLAAFVLLAAFILLSPSVAASGESCYGSVYFNVYNTTVTVTIWNPTNSTYETLDVYLNFSAYAGGPLDTCWYEINGTNHTLANCHNAEVWAINGTNNITVYANDSSGNVGWAIAFFSINPDIAGMEMIAVIGFALLVLFFSWMALTMRKDHAILQLVFFGLALLLAALDLWTMMYFAGQHAETYSYNVLSTGFTVMLFIMITVGFYFAVEFILSYFGLWGGKSKNANSSPASL